MRLRKAAWIALSLSAACSHGVEPVTYQVHVQAGDAQTDTVGRALPVPLRVLVQDHRTPPQPLAAVLVTWSVSSGLITTRSETDSTGVASATWTLGHVPGIQTAHASVAGADAAFTATALPASPAQATKRGDGQIGAAGAQLPAAYGVLVVDEFGNAVPGVVVTWTVTAGGGSLSTTSSETGATGIAETRYTLGATFGPNAVQAVVAVLNDTLLFTASATEQPALVATVPIPAAYGIHDTFVRDGLAFVCAWDSGVLIFDVGNGIRGGSPSNPVRVSKIVTAGGEAHNAWWFWNPNTNEKKYLFVGQEGPGAIGSSSSGDIHVVDVSDLTAPVEVASFHLTGAGTHNFWMDEGAGILYAAYYNAGVVALNVSGTLAGDLSARGIDTLQLGGPNNTYTWGVQLYNGSLYAIDMMSGLWQVNTTSGALSVAAGGNNEPSRYSSDLWAHGGYVYTGTWDHARRSGAAGSLLKVWHLDGSGAPVAVDSILTSNVGAVSDVEVSSNGKLLMFSAEGGTNAGLHFYSLADPAHPTLRGMQSVSGGVHTATLGYIGGRVYAFAAKNPSSPALLIFDVTNLAGL
jgi:hypothetical protein